MYHFWHICQCLVLVFFDLPGIFYQTGGVLHKSDGSENSKSKDIGRQVKKMEAPNIKVKCSVDNCQYNRNKMCYAKSLEVNAMGDGRAKTSDGTCCTTFVNK